jgi:hypothetical protein
MALDPVSVTNANDIVSIFNKWIIDNNYRLSLLPGPEAVSTITKEWRWLGDRYLKHLIKKLDNVGKSHTSITYKKGDE